MYIWLSLSVRCEVHSWSLHPSVCLSVVSLSEYCWSWWRHVIDTALSNGLRWLDRRRALHGRTGWQLAAITGSSCRPIYSWLWGHKILVESEKKKRKKDVLIKNKQKKHPRNPQVTQLPLCSHLTLKIAQIWSLKSHLFIVPRHHSKGFQPDLALRNHQRSCTEKIPAKLHCPVVICVKFM